MRQQSRSDPDSRFAKLVPRANHHNTRRKERWKSTDRDRQVSRTAQSVQLPWPELLDQLPKGRDPLPAAWRRVSAEGYVAVVRSGAIRFSITAGCIAKAAEGDITARLTCRLVNPRRITTSTNRRGRPPVQHAQLRPTQALCRGPVVRRSTVRSGPTQGRSDRPRTGRSRSRGNDR